MALPPMPLPQVGQFFEIFPANKTKHFANLRSTSKVEYHEMIFFDNERRNCTDVARLGVICV